MKIFAGVFFKNNLIVVNLSDWIGSRPFDRRLHFLRHIERGDNVSHEEKERAVEEQPFSNEIFFVEQSRLNGEGGRVAENGRPFPSCTLMMRPSEWLAANALDHGGDAPVFIVDCLGHFVVARPVLCQVGEELIPTTVVVNTTLSNYINPRIVLLAHRMMFDRRSEVDDPHFTWKTRYEEVFVH